MIATRFTELVGCAAPVQQAGMGAVAPPELAAAVSEAGGLGMLGTARAGLSPSTLAPLLDRVRALTAKPFGVNFLVSPVHLNGGPNRPPPDLRCVEVAARAARVAEFFYGAPERRLVDMAHAGGALACWQVGSRAEAVAAAEAGCDLIVAQGVEAGGHVRGTTGLLPLLAEVLDAVDVPVLAAGGIGTARAVAGGARGRGGRGAGGHTLRGRAGGERAPGVRGGPGRRAGGGGHRVHGGVPRRLAGRAARVLRSCVEAAETFRGDVVGEADRLDGTRMPIPRFASMVADKTATGAVGAMSLWAGQSVGGVTRVQPAAEVVRELAEGAEALLRR